MMFQKAAASLMLAAFTAFHLPATAQQATEPTAAPARPAIRPETMKYASALHLAYVRSTSARINEDSRTGLEALAHTLREKTSAVPAGVAGVNIEQDDISFFPFLYWNISASTPPLSEKAQAKVQSFINSGGVIVFDTDTPSGTLKALRRVLGNVTTRPLIPMPHDHTLTRSFYLVSSLPGSNNFNNIRVESPGVKDRNYASSVIVGENNWAAAWAGRTLPFDSREREMALRSGVNMVMFALTGNYADDAIHKPALREKLGR